MANNHSEPAPQEQGIKLLEVNLPFQSDIDLDMSWISGRDAQYKTDVTEANRQLAAIRAADRAETKTLRNEKERLKWLLKSHIKNEARLLEQLQALKAKYGES